jgi:hypothetical protein
MNVSKQILYSGFTGNHINIPINLDWEYLDVDAEIKEYETSVVSELITTDNDFEVDRFFHADYNNKSEINYEFYFYEGSSLSNPANWKIDYRAEGFTTQDVYYYSNSFTNSFFKLDLYDSPIESQQENYITIILPTQQGLRMTTKMQTTDVQIRKPQFLLDYVGDKEGFFIYWLKKRNFLDISTFYMTAKFFDGKTGQFVRMMNRPQSTIQGNKYIFSSSDYFYYRVELDYLTHSYEVYDIINPTDRVGGTIPIKWYEYVNP